MTMAATRAFRDLLNSATLTLTDAGIPDARREAESLIIHILNRPRLDLYRDDGIALDSDQQQAFAALVRRRASREPLQHILGTQEFWGLDFRVTADTLIPRPETELLIEAVVERFPRPDVPSILVDLCTGTGCVAVTLATLFPGTKFLATDQSPAALILARLNASRHGMAERIKYLEGDLLEPLTAIGVHHRVDAMTANPPYVPSGDLDQLQPEVRDFEPRAALDGGPDGLDYYRRILPGALDFLRPGGPLFLEVGIGQAVPIRDMAESLGWRVDQIKKDLAGIDRIVVLTKP